MIQIKENKTGEAYKILLQMQPKFWLLKLELKRIVPIIKCRIIVGKVLEKL
jgi:hypothetical protein